MGDGCLLVANNTMSNAPSTTNGKPADDRPLIFAVDDEPMLLELATMVIEPLGFRVETFRDPIAAVRAFSLANPLPELILTDFSMHQMNGLDLIRDVRRIHPQQKILMVSGTVSEDIYKDSPYKPDAFLPKPYQTITLARFIAELTGRD